jgi:Protein of unknown function (DUF3703)
MMAAGKARASELIAEEMALYRSARLASDSATAWRALERAHIISQPYLKAQLANHSAMLGFAINQHDWREIVGQVFRLVLAPLGTLTGQIPVGNTGRSNVSAFQAMPIPDDLASQLCEPTK